MECHVGSNVAVGPRPCPPAAPPPLPSAATGERAAGSPPSPLHAPTRRLGPREAGWAAGTAAAQPRSGAPPPPPEAPPPRSAKEEPSPYPWSSRSAVGAMRGPEGAGEGHAAPPMAAGRRRRARPRPLRPVLWGPPPCPAAARASAFAALPRSAQVAPAPARTAFASRSWSSPAPPRAPPPPPCSSSSSRA